MEDKGQSEDDSLNGDVLPHEEEDDFLQEIDESLPVGISQEDRQNVHAVFARHTTGPLPSGSEMHEYMQIDPELPRLIFDMARDEQKHRHAIETAEQHKSYEAVYKNQDNARQVAKRGQLLGFGIAVIVLGLAALMAVLGFPTLAAILAGIDVIGLAAVFVSSYRTSQETTDIGDDNKSLRDSS